MELVLQTLVNSVSLSAFYILMAVGLTLVFGVMKIANLAHGEFYMIGAYTLWFLYAKAHWPFFIAVISAFIVGSVLGIILERVLYRRMRGNILGGAIMSIGIVLILQVFMGQMWGVKAKFVPAAFPGSITLFYGITIPWQRFAIVIAAIFLLLLLWVFLNQTQIGRGLRACAQDAEAAALQGISINMSGAIALGLGCALAGIAGALMAPVIAVHPYMGFTPLIMALVIVIVGGPGNIKGTIIAALIFGFVYTFFTTYWDSTVANIASVLLMVVLLAFKPGGLVGYGKK